MNKVKILIVDDYQENINALSELIAAPDVELFTALTPETALELLNLHEFGLALFDVHMPGMSGFDLARLVRSVNRHKHLPIIFVTANEENRDFVFEGYETGAVDLLFKPLIPHMVRSKVRVFVELSQQKRLLQEQVDELKLLRLEAEAANIAKSQFLANMSHEIRTPLAAVLGFSEILTRESFSMPEKKEYAFAIQRNGNLLLRLIDDILDLTKIESNRLDLDIGAFDLSEVLRDINSTLSFRAQEKSVRLKFKLPQEPLGSYSGDIARVKQILLNIVGNAIKFSDRGSVRVSVSTQPSEHKGMDLIRILVADDGIGLTSEQCARLFEPFRQADATTRRKYGGSGLGLVISKRLAQAMNGDLILAQSTPGLGSTFEITLKLPKVAATVKPAQLAATQKPTAVDFSDRTILVVDDSPDNLTLMSLFLRPTKANLVFANNGEDAIKTVSENRPDLILMDVQMPELDGREAARLIRKGGYLKPIVALTAHALQSEHDSCREAGCTEVLSKPIGRENLLRAMANYLQ